MKRFLLVCIVFINFSFSTALGSSFLKRVPDELLFYLSAGGLFITGMLMYQGLKEGAKEKEKYTKLNIQNMVLKNKLKAIKKESVETCKVDIEKYVTKKANITQELNRLNRQAKSQSELNKTLGTITTYLNVMNNMSPSGDNMKALNNIYNELTGLRESISSFYKNNRAPGRVKTGHFFLKSGLLTSKKDVLQITYKTPIYLNSNNEFFIESHAIVDAVKKKLETNETFNLELNGNNLDANFWIKPEDIEKEELNYVPLSY